MAAPQHRADPLHEPLAGSFESLVRALDERELWLHRLEPSTTLAPGQRSSPGLGAPGESCNREAADVLAAIGRANSLHAAWMRGDLQPHSWPHVQRALREIVAEAERRTRALLRYGELPPDIDLAFEQMMMRHYVSTWGDDDVAARSASADGL